MERISYFLKEGFRNIWVNFWMSLASIGILIICLVLMGTGVLLSLNLNNMIGQLDNTDQIMAYMNGNLKQAEMQRVQDDITDIGNVKKCKFVSRNELFSQAKKQLGGQGVLLNGIDSTVFDNAYQVSVKEMSKYAETADSIGKIKGIKYVRQDAELASMLTRARKVIDIVGFWLFIILAVISLFIISNTIKLAMYSRKREINIMKFVGATDWFIRIPFLIEGIIIGIASGIIAVVLQYYVYNGLILKAVSALPALHLVSFSSLSVFIVPGFFICGILVATLGSLISVRRYLKV